MKDTIAHTRTTPELLFKVLVCMLLIWYLQFLWSRRKLYQHSWKLPGPFGLPLIGNALHFVGSPYDIFTSIMKMFNEYPSIFRVWIGPRLFYAVSEPKHYEILLSRCMSKFDLYKHGEELTGHGLVTAPVDKWKKNRKLIMPTFNQKVLDGYVEIFSEQSDILVEQLKQLVGKGEFDVFEDITKCAVDMICETAMGVKINNQTTNDKPIFQWIDIILENIFLRMVVVFYQVDVIFNLTNRAKNYRTTLRQFHDFCGSVIKEKKRLFDKAKTRSDESVDFIAQPNRKIFLDYVLEISADGNKFTEQELKDEVHSFIIAGSDTAASTIAFAFIMLGLHKDLQERGYEEVIEVVGPDRAVDKDDLPKLQYLDRFIKETLRLFPVISLFGRVIEEDVDLGNHLVPAGASVVFGILKTHTDEKYWPDPFKFDPDRFLPEEVAKRHPYAYMPFSLGPRNCIGAKYATMAMKTMLATVLKTFKVSTPYRSVQDIVLKSNLFLRPRDGHKVSLELRKSHS